MGFKIGQKVIYPNHGIGTIEQIQQKQFGVSSLFYYTLRLLSTNTIVLVPVSNAEEVGLRNPITTAECEMLIKCLADDFETCPLDWKDRFREFSERMRSGDIFEVANVLKRLTHLSHTKPLSFREQRIYERAKYMIVSELSTVCHCPEEDILTRIDQALARACTKHDRKSLRIQAAAGASMGH